jgi:hypothetical protein
MAFRFSLETAHPAAALHPVERPFCAPQVLHTNRWAQNIGGLQYQGPQNRVYRA